MQAVIEGMAIGFSLLFIFAIITSFVLFMWFIGRKERMILKEYGQAEKLKDEELDHE